MRPLDELLRKHILTVKPYSSARSEYPTSGNAASNTASVQTSPTQVFLDANENAFGSPAALHVNRYPDPLQMQLKKRIAEIKGIPADRINTIFLGNGSDEPIDLIIRAFCEPMTDGMTETGDEIIITPPTYGMYEVSAAIHNIRLRRVPLVKTTGSNDAGFRLDADAVLHSVTPRTKVIFLCSPNNPTANLLETSDVERVVRDFDGIVVLDEAYIDFAAEHSLLPRLQATPNAFPNLIILQTFSKAWGMAGLRLGMAFARAEIIGVLNKIKPPYNINALAQEAALKALQDVAWQKNVVEETLRERAFVQAALEKYPFVRRIFPSDANFLLVEMENARGWYERLLKANVIVRDRSSVALCEDCLRITIGTKEENMRLLGALNE